MPAFPTLVYRAPGSSQHSSGGRYRYRGAANQAEYDALLAEGWHSTILAAIVAAGERAFAHNRKPAGLLAKARAKLDAQPAAPEVEPTPDDDAPPTREEMLAQAQLLGLKVDKRWSDETLLAKVNAAMTPAPDDPI